MSFHDKCTDKDFTLYRANKCSSKTGNKKYTSQIFQKYCNIDDYIAKYTANYTSQLQMSNYALTVMNIMMITLTEYSAEYSPL